MKNATLWLIVVGGYVGMVHVAEHKHAEQYELLLQSADTVGSRQEDSDHPLCTECPSAPVEKCVKTCKDSSGYCLFFSPSLCATVCKIGLRLFCCTSWEHARDEHYETFRPVCIDCVRGLDHAPCGRALNMCCS